MKKITLNENMKLELELNVYHCADLFWENYNGGSWSFSEEYQYWYPLTKKESIKISNTNNYFEGSMSSNALGLALSMMVCSNLSFKYFDINQTISTIWANLYYELRDLALNNFSNTDQVAIFGFLD